MFKRGAEHRTAFKQGEGQTFFLFFAIKTYLVLKFLDKLTFFVVKL